MIKTRFVLPVLAASAALALLAGCGGGSSSSSSDPATVAPPDSPLYVEGTLRPTGSLQANVNSLAKTVAGVDDLGELIISELESSAEESGESFDYETEVEPWLEGQAGLSFTGYDGEDFQGFSAAIPTTDSDAAQAFIDKQAKSEEGPATDGSYEGVDFKVEQDDGQTIGMIGDLLVFSEDEKSFKDAVDASNDESLADVDAYTSAISRAPSGSLADVYVDIGALVRQSGGSIDEQAQQVLQSTGIDLDEATALASLVPGSDQVEIDISSDLGDAEVDASPASDLLGSLPASAFAAFATSDFGKNLEEGINTLDESGVPGEIPPNQLKDGLKGVGIDLEKISSSFEDAAIFATGNSESTLSGAAVITTESGSEAKNTVSSIGLLLRATDTPGVTVLKGKASGFSIRDPELGSKPLVVAAEGDRIAIGYGVPATLLGLSSEPSATLSGVPAYKEAVAALGGTSITGFVNGPATLRLVESLVPRSEVEFEEAKPYLKKASYIAVGSDTEDGVATAKLLVGIEK